MKKNVRLGGVNPQGKSALKKDLWKNKHEKTRPNWWAGSSRLGKVYIYNEFHLLHKFKPFSRWNQAIPHFQGGYQ